MPTTTIVLPRLNAFPASASGFADSAASALAQEYGSVRLVVPDSTGEPLPAALSAEPRLVHVPGPFESRAAALNAGLRQTTGRLTLLIDPTAGPVRLRRSAAQALYLASGRSTAGLLYADYTLTAPNGGKREVHLLDHHPGRLRDDFDMGPVWAIPGHVLEEIGGLNERFHNADLYDLRLRIAERYELTHIGSRTDGSLYDVLAEATANDVFAYLLANREAQVEAEQALTEHLKRIGAWLPPDRPVWMIEYSQACERRFDSCLVSVVIPVYRRPEFISQAIESVQAQTITHTECIVVVNGGDDDPTADVVRRYLPGGDLHDPARPEVRLLVLDVNNIGLCLNAGIGAARGKYYVQLDSDDRLKPDAMEKLIEVFESDPHIGMVIGSYEVWEQNGQTGQLSRREDIPVVRHEEWTEQNGPNNLLRVNGAGAPRAAHIKVIREVGGFGLNDTPFSRNYGEDYDLVLRISERYRIGRVWDPIYEVVRHAGGTDHAIDQATIDRNNEAKDFLRNEAIRRRTILNAELKST